MAGLRLESQSQSTLGLEGDGEVFKETELSFEKSDPARIMKRASQTEATPSVAFARHVPEPGGCNVWSRVREGRKKRDEVRDVPWTR